MREDIRYNRGALTQALTTCYDHPTDEVVNGESVNPCQQKLQETLRLLRAVDESDLEVPASQGNLDDTKCAAARAWALEEGHITQEEYRGYSNLSWAPIYQRPHDRHSGFQGWGSCGAVAGDL